MDQDTERALLRRSSGQALLSRLTRGTAIAAVIATAGLAVAVGRVLPGKTETVANAAAVSPAASPSASSAAPAAPSPSSGSATTAAPTPTPTAAATPAPVVVSGGS
jgi:hypothetical protein